MSGVNGNWIKSRFMVLWRWLTVSHLITVFLLLSGCSGQIALLMYKVPLVEDMNAFQATFMFSVSNVNDKADVGAACLGCPFEFSIVEEACRFSLNAVSLFLIETWSWHWKNCPYVEISERLSNFLLSSWKQKTSRITAVILVGLTVWLLKKFRFVVLFWYYDYVHRNRIIGGWGWSPHFSL